MVLGDLLDELRSNMLRDRSSQIAGASDLLWSDTTLVRYINAAQDRFAKRSEILRDFSTPECCTITLVAGQEFYGLHPKVIGVLSARYLGNATQPIDGADLARAGHSNLDTYTSVDNRYFDTSLLTTLKPGKVIAFTTDEGLMTDNYNALNTMAFRTFPTIGAGYDGTIGLRVVRFPLRHLRVDSPNDQPEIPEQYHLNMLDWAAYLALRGPDLDVAGGDAPNRGRELAASFEKHVNDAKVEMMRRMKPQIAFKFGGNGFSYERDWST